MFGYIIVNKPEMKFKEFDLYQSFYCGLCKALKDSHGRVGQLTLSYDMTFVVLLLTSLYEPDTVMSYRKCIAHPLVKHPARVNEFSRYGADMNLLLSYYKCLDDWEDERKFSRKTMAAALQKQFRKVAAAYPEKEYLIREKMEQIHNCEEMQCANLDEVSGYFGEIMAEIFAYRQDEWEMDLRRMGFFLGKFIYLMDAYEDLEKDKKRQEYNPFLKMVCQRETDFETFVKLLLTSMMSESAKSFERLPILLHADILRNVLYSGVWSRYEYIQVKKRKQQEKKARGKQNVKSV